MNVFISWSGDRSRKIAEALKRFVEDCLAPIEVFVSSVDMVQGMNWHRELERRLTVADVGILCLTMESLQSPWVLFEAGAMMRARLLIPYLVDVPYAKLPPPLAAYQGGVVGGEASLKLLHAIAEAGAMQLTPGLIERRFDAFWPQADAAIGGRKESPAQRDWLGIERVFGSRRAGFAAFASLMRQEAEEIRKRLWIIGSSMQGFDVGADDARWTIWDAIGAVAGTDCLRILLTAPEHSQYREAAEEKGLEGQIKTEIAATLAKLIEQKRVPGDSVRLYPGTPTVSAIATSDYMLLNPYPYAVPAHTCFSMLVRRTASTSVNIYDQYLHAHFERGWALGRALSDVDY